MASEFEVATNVGEADQTAFPEDVVLTENPIPVKETQRKKGNKEEIAGTLLASIPLVGFVIFGMIPLIMALAMAFLYMPRFGFEGAEFNGFKNFVTVLTDDMFWQSVWNTVLLGLSTFISLALALVVAYFLSKDIKGRKAFRMIYFIPYVCSVVAITLMWGYMFNTNWGIINHLLGRTGENAIDWMGEAGPYRLAVIIMSVWSGMGYGIILFTAALTNVNKEMIEAAEIDGANAWVRFWRIVFPSISPTTFYLLVMGVIGMLQSFAVTNVLNGGNSPDGVGITIVYYLYNRIFNYIGAMGEASASAWILGIIILGLTVFQFWGSKKWVNYD